MIDNPESLQTATQFGVAGLMGALWLWERLYSRKREQQLTEAHQRLIAQQLELQTLIDLVSRNTGAIERFEQTQQRLFDLLERMDQARRVA
ncbi:MAG: hypothetical protein KTR15_03255 [Phycisphaeraceae bacterium]|nr:hypothetical protein [Phycisphaeraceae bacterium]